MANKRELKKYVNRASNELAFASFLTGCSIDGTDFKRINDLIIEVNTLKIRTLYNVTFAFDKMPKDFDDKKAYRAARRRYFATAYKKLHAEFAEHYQKLVDELNAITAEATKSEKAQ